ncbi:MAG TPA: hypothetical protein VFT74_03715 [Isosphaeraceae bacterium]|nr:hypothetical protein [Isosphaeraceae bacterium]
MIIVWMSCVLLGLGPQDVGQAANEVFGGLVGPGLRLSEQEIRFPEPSIRDGQADSQQRTALEEVCGSSARADDLLRDSVYAPFVLKLEDRDGKNGDVVRVAHLWFAIRADFAKLDPEQFTPGEADPVEAANMRFGGKVVDEKELKAQGIELPKHETGQEQVWYVHSTGDLLDRIHVEKTTKVEATRSDESLLVAAMPAKEFGIEGPAPSFWKNTKEGGSVQAYDGGGGYVKVTRYKPIPGVLIVEAHLAFLEPEGWFQGRPILRSKIGIVTQDQIRDLRRSLAKP